MLVRQLHETALYSSFLSDNALQDNSFKIAVPEPFNPIPQSAIQARIGQFIIQLQLALQAERERGTGFLLLPVSAGAGIVTYFTRIQETGWLSLIVTLCLLVVIRWWLRERYYLSHMLLLAMFFQLGMLCGKFETWRYSTAMVGSDVTTRLTGRVVGLEAQFNGNWRLTIDVLATERPVLRYAPERLRMTARDIPAQTEIGSILTGFARLRPHSGPARPGNYDFAFNGYFKGNGGNGFYLGVPILTEAATKRTDTTLSEAIASLRHMVASRVTSVVSGENGAIAAALISGQRDGISEETNEALRHSGLAHVLSISGLHLALAAGVVMIGFRAFFGLFPFFAARHPIKKYAAVAALFSSAFYLALSGAEVAAQRSFVMIVVMLVALLYDRAALSMRNLAIAALIAFVSAPHEVLGPSFQMSFSATAGLIAAFAWWSDRKSTLHNQGKKRTGKPPGFLKKWLFALAATAATSIVAGIATGIYSAYHFHNTAPFGLIGNVLSMPVISIIIMPFAVLSLLLMPFQLDWLPLQIMGSGIWIMRQIAELVSSIAPAGNPGIIPSAAMLSWTIALLIAVICTTRLRVILLIFVVLGFGYYAAESDPEIMVAEDARLVAVRLADGELAVNRPRSSRFTLQNWVKAYDARAVVPPVIAEAKKNDIYREDAFYCEEKICSIPLSDGRMLSYTDELTAVETACNIGDVVILAVAGKNMTCPFVDKLIVTRRDLALKGALEIRLGQRNIAKTDRYKTMSSNMDMTTIIEPDHNFIDDEIDVVLLEKIEGMESLPGSNVSQYSSSFKKLKNNEKILKYNDKLTYSVGEPQRPWHLYRLYSRAARGLADYKKSGKISQ